MDGLSGVGRDDMKKTGSIEVDNRRREMHRTHQSTYISRLLAP